MDRNVSTNKQLAISNEEKIIQRLQNELHQLRSENEVTSFTKTSLTKYSLFHSFALPSN